ncbi:MAG: hypothetical protein K1X86_13730 [Ignavibacteria bacterium]|nr:hypothetical protein [Ignavibacteria bacterium]
MKFVAAKCPSCGGDLQVPDDKDFVECEYCGADVKVRDVIKIKVENNLSELMDLAGYSSNAGNYREAYLYYSKALELDADNTAAWFGKANALTQIAEFNQLLEPVEILSYYKNAYEKSAGDGKAKMAFTIANNITSFAAKLYQGVQSQKDKYPENDLEWKNYLERCGKIILTIEKAIEYNPEAPEYYKTIFQIVNANLEGISCKITRVYGRRRSTFIKKNNITPEYKKYLETKLDYYGRILISKDPLFMQGVENERKAKKQSEESKKLLTICIAASVIASCFLGGLITGIVSPDTLKKDLPVVFFFSSVVGAGIGFAAFFVINTLRKK